jgi:signal transduction histidine kinase
VLSRFPIRWRLALISAALTFVILCGFALAIGQITVSRIRSDFRNETKNAATELGDRLDVRFSPSGQLLFRGPSLDDYAAPTDAAIRVFDGGGRLLAQTSSAPNLGFPAGNGSSDARGFRLESRRRFVLVSPNVTVPVLIQYARPIEDLNQTVARVRLVLFFGVVGGTLLALLGGLVLARRSLRPVTDITAAAREIAQTGDPALKVPQPSSDDEVAELARTFEEMLAALETARVETEDALRRQREFVADASHELRTPLTSVLANLELLSCELRGEQLEAADGALRSARRMRRLVADLLLLARSDTGRERAIAPADLGQIALDAVAEAHALAAGHELSADVTEPVLVSGVRDELHRMTLNLVENAIHHTPAGTPITVSARTDGDDALLIVEDRGPGVPPELQARIFERFVSAAGDRGSSTGLGLAIVRAVARAHHGDVELDPSAAGARFVVRLPRAQPTSGAPAEPATGSRPVLWASDRGDRASWGPEGDTGGIGEGRHGDPGPRDDAHGTGRQTSTTTGSTIGRLRRRS